MSENMIRHHCSKSHSCESLFQERSSLKRKYSKLSANDTSAMSTSSMSFKNDDYNYLINCDELIATCREALLENESIITNVISLPVCANIFVESVDKSKDKNAKEDNCHEDPLIEFSKWLNFIENQLELTCYCKETKDGPIEAELTDESQWTDRIQERKSIQSEIEIVGRRFINSIKSNANSVTKTVASEENRWYSIWLKSLEFLMILEECNKCPNHYRNRKESLSDQVANSPAKRYKTSCKTTATTSSATTANLMKNRRIQTNMVGTSPSDAFSFDGAKFEIIQKDIGYSSDADMSDACEAHPYSQYLNLSSSSSRSARRRQVRRRRTRVTRRRPWSFHSDWTDWDYYQPPFHCYNGSDDTLSYDDENTIRNLIEFGENYEFWFKNEDDAIIRASTPAKEIHESNVLADEKVSEESQCVAELNSNERKEEREMKQRTSHEREGCLKDKLSESERNATKPRRSSYFIYMAVTIFALFVSTFLANLPPHIHKTYPYRPPPI